MPRLAQYRNKPPLQVEGILDGLAKTVAGLAGEHLSEHIERNSSGLQGIQAQLAVLLPSFEKSLEAALKKALAEGVKDVSPDLKKLAKQLESVAGTQRQAVKLQADFVQALDRVKIPDYTDALLRLEQKQPDLSGVLEKIQDIKVETPEPVTEWRFEVERDGEGLIKAINAVGE